MSQKLILDSLKGLRTQQYEDCVSKDGDRELSCVPKGLGSFDMESVSRSHVFIPFWKKNE